MAAAGWWEKSVIHQLKRLVGYLVSLATTSLHYGATAAALAKFPGAKNLVAGTGITLTSGSGTLTVATLGGSSQDAIQFEDEGVALGAAGTVDTVDFVGAGVTATRVGDAVTVTITGARRTLGMTFDGGGSAPTVGSVGYVVSQLSGSISRWDIVGDAVGSAVVDVWKAVGAIPTNANTIAGSEKPTLTAQQLNNDSSLTTWTLPVAVGDVLGFELESVSTCTRITCEVQINES